MRAILFVLLALGASAGGCDNTFPPVVFNDIPDAAQADAPRARDTARMADLVPRVDSQMSAPGSVCALSNEHPAVCQISAAGQTSPCLLPDHIPSDAANPSACCVYQTQTDTDGICCQFYTVESANADQIWRNCGAGWACYVGC